MTRALFACVGEADPGWLHRMENLVLSIRNFGGSLADSPVVVSTVGEAPAQMARRLREAGAELRVVGPVDRRKPTSNKFRALELADERDFDVLVMLDADVILMGDLARELDPQTLRALPAGRAHIARATWERLYTGAGLAMPSATTTLVRTGETSPPYYNSGVLFVPRPACGPLREHWLGHLTRLLDGAAAAAGLDGVRKDQVPLALALASAGLPVRDLPVNLNLSTTQHRPSRAFRHQFGPPFIFHYHHCYDADGFVLPSPWAAINPWLDRFNRARADRLGLRYAGLGRIELRRAIASRLRARPWYARLRGG